MMVDTGSFADWVGIAFKVAAALAVVLSVVFGWALWSLRREVVTRQDFADWAKTHEDEHERLEDRLSDGDVRFARMETTLEHLPTKSDVEKVRSEVGQVAGAVQALSAGMDGLTRAVGSIGEQFNMLLQNHVR